MIVENNLLFELFLLINAEFAVNGDLGSVLGSPNLILLHILLAILSYVSLIFSVLLTILLIILVLLIILNITLLLSVVVTDRAWLTLIEMLLLKLILGQFDLILPMVFEHTTAGVDHLLLRWLHASVDVLKARVATRRSCAICTRHASLITVCLN